ncbi:FAD-dependent oxidoreductase [Paenibacillus hamazuiensis]|uniref:FAD-dependent oxidoreductase n=1 Tax=Paenibacillus hamazuiensis TaxID=2936508 RepID=UPI00200EC6E3|nr:FAD-dependent oxidoreductase [Paenibacillus hamazuiensis]
MNHADVVVYGATPGGFGAAVASARRGRNTVLIEPTPYLGGLMTSGLGVTDIHSLDAAGCVFREFAGNVLDYYVAAYGAESEQVLHCRGGLRFEPHVAKKIFWEMVNKESAHLKLIFSHELVSADVSGSELRSATFRPVQGGEEITFAAEVFIDATYEGDLAAKAGVPYSLGRESRDEWNEEYAGKLYQVFRTKDILPGSTGEGDHRLQAYNFRLCLTKNPDNRVPFQKPERYNRDEYASLIEDVRAGRITAINGAINIVQIPNGKSDTNNHHYSMLSTDLPEENLDYPEGSREVREQIIRRHREYIQGLLWFLQNDEELPAEFREDARQWGYAADEFEDTDHFPPQIYVREARRIHGEYVFTENDARLAPGLDRSPIHYDSIASGDYGIDSHATRKRDSIGQHMSLEGFMAIGFLTEIYQIPYGCIVPKKIDRLLVPVAVSATHMGLGTIRMEPCWMQIGFAAGVAADISISAQRSVRGIPIDALHDELLAENAVITHFTDVPLGTDESKAAQYFGAKSFLTSYEARLQDTATLAETAQWISWCRTFDGGRPLPSLPASDRILPAGVDMGPRSPKTDEPAPRDHWREKPYLTSAMALRWFGVAAKALGVRVDSPFSQESEHATRGQVLVALYKLLREARNNRAGIGERDAAGRSPAALLRA